jgi:hypothetical protein
MVAQHDIRLTASCGCRPTKPPHRPPSLFHFRLVVSWSSSQVFQMVDKSPNETTALIAAGQRGSSTQRHSEITSEISRVTSATMMVQDGVVEDSTDKRPPESSVEPTGNTKDAKILVK